MTERPKASARGAAGANLRPYLVALLAAAYALTWWLLGTRAPAQAAEVPTVEPPAEASAEPATAIWFHDLPPDERPAVSVPAGWHIADRTAASATAPTAPAVTVRAAPVRVRVAPARARRVRTRSS